MVKSKAFVIDKKHVCDIIVHTFADVHNFRRRGCIINFNGEN